MRQLKVVGGWWRSWSEEGDLWMMQDRKRKQVKEMTQ